VSTESRDLGYSPPPGVFDVAGRRDAGLQVGATQVNERSLRLLARGLAPGLRAEAFTRFVTEGDKNFLKYKRLRTWARGRGPGWDDGDLEFYIKAGKDANNFYLYHTPARTSSWEPEVVVDFDRWLALRGQIERAWLSGDTAQVYPGCPDTTLVPPSGAYVMCDGPYIVHVRDPATAPPNLARVQEIAAGILRVRSTVFVDEAELWVDDIRLSDVVQDVGLAGAIDVTMGAADFADLALSVSRRDGRFRQLGDDPTYVTDDVAIAGGTMRLDRFLPDHWGLTAPLTIRHAVTASDPFYLNRTDLRADALGGVRTPRSDATTYGLVVRRTRRAESTVGRLVFDPVSFDASYARGHARSDFSDATTRSYTANVDYNLFPRAATTRVLGVPIRLAPTSLRLRSGLAGTDAERFTFDVPVVRPSDAAILPATSRSKAWRNAGTIDLLPLTGLQLRFDASSIRDLRDYGDSTSIARLTQIERRTFLGMDVGFEAQRAINSLVALSPSARGWLRPRATYASTFALSRDPNARDPVRETGDTAGAFRLPAAFSNSRRVEVGTQLDAGRLGRKVFGDSSGLARALTRITTSDVSLSRTYASTFTRVGFTPTLGYQLALGGLDEFRAQRGLLASSASDNTAVTAGAGGALPLGLRATTSYRRSSGTSWVLRTDQQVPIRTESREWPSGSVGWNVTPAGLPLSSLTAQLGFRRTTARTELRGLIGAAEATVTETRIRSLSPALTLTWAGGILTSGDATVERNEQRSAGNLFRTARSQYNVNVGFAVRIPTGLARLPMPLRVNARLSRATNTTCLQTAGAATCVPYLDSRQTQGNLTLDTDFPPNVSAGFQMAYLVNEERQASRKVRQIAITAFVNLATTVGRLQ
jgi:hypothetical protein